MIDYRKANKDKIEDFIIKTRLAELDPDIRKSRQDELNRLRSQQTRLDQDATDYAESVISALKVAEKAFTDASGKISAEELKSEAKQRAAVISGQASVASSLNAALASVANAKINAASREDVSRIERDAVVLKEVAQEAAAATAGEAGRFADILKMVDSGTDNAGNYVAPPTDKASFEEFLKRVWRQEYDARYSSAQSPVQKKALLDEFRRASQFALDRSNNKATIESGFEDTSVDASGNIVEIGGISKAAADAIGLSSRDLVYDIQEVMKEGAKARGYTDEQGGSFNKYGFTPRYGPGMGSVSVMDKSVEELPRWRRLGLKDENAIEPTITRAAFNRYLYEKSTDPSRKDEEELTYEAFVEQAKDPASLAGKYRQYVADAPDRELVLFADRNYVDLLMRREGVSRDITDLQATLAKPMDIPSSAEIQRETLEEYSRTYGSRGQKRLVQLSDYAKKTPITYKDPATGEEKTAFLDTPEYEFLFGTEKGGGGGGIGKGGGKIKPTPPPKTPPPTPPTPPPPPPETLPKEQTPLPETRGKITEEGEGPPNLDLTPLTPEQRGMTGRIDTTGRFPEEQTFFPQERAQREGQAGPTERIGAKDIQTFKEGKETLKTLPPINVEEITTPEEFDNAGAQLTDRARKLQAQIKLAETPEEQQSLQEQIAEVSKQARRLVVRDQRNELTDEDFGSLTQEELIAKATPKKPVKLSPQAIKDREQFFIEGDSQVAARGALEDQTRTGKEPKPEKFIPTGNKIPQRAIAFLKDLASKKGRISAEELNKAVVAVLGENASAKDIATAKSIYLAYEQIA